MPNTKFVELRIDNSPQYIARHKKDLGYAPDNSVMSNTFKESTLNRIVKNLRNNNIKAIVIDDAILMTNTNNINENINEIKINPPDLGYKIADWVYKYFTEDPYELDWDKAEYHLGPNSDELNALTILYFNMNIFERNTVTKDDIERWRNAHDSNLKDNTVDEIIHYLTSLVLIKKNQSLNEVKINQPTPGLPVDFTNNVKDAINRHIVSLVKEHEGYYETPAVEFIKDENYGTHDAVIEFIKEHMVVNHYEFEKDGKEIIASPLNVSTISDEDVLDYLNDNIDLKSYINKVIWKAYFETIDIGKLRNQVFDYITKKEHPDLPHQRNTKEYFDVYIPLLIDKVVDYYIEPSEIFTENDFIQSVNNTLLKSNFINEIKINKPTVNYEIAYWVKEAYNTDDADYDEIKVEYGEDEADAARTINDMVDLNKEKFINLTIVKKWLEDEETLGAYAAETSTPESIIKFLLEFGAIIDPNELNETKINNPDPYKYKVGETVRGLEVCKILDKRPNWEAVIENPIKREYILFQRPSTFSYSDSNASNEPWYLVQWLEDNADKKPIWWAEEDLQPQDSINEIKINKPNSRRYRLSWYEGPNQFQQEKIETTLSNAERIVIEKLKTQYQYRKSDDYWAIISYIEDNDETQRWREAERIALNPEPDGLYIDVNVYDEDKNELITTKTIKL